MRKVIGLFIIVVGFALGIYVGLWWAFIGGIVELIDAIKETPVDSMGVAFGIVRVAFAALVGWATFAVIAFIGAVVGNANITVRRRRGR